MIIVRGFSLIEVMISSFVLALGLLGLVAMQSTAVKSAVEVQQRTLANSLFIDISERMQLNRLWLLESGNDYAVVSLMDANLSAPTCVASDGTFDNCSGEEVKDNDLFEWKKKFLGSHTVSSTGSSGLIGADACIEYDGAGSSTIILSWSSTVKSKDAAADFDTSSLAYQCGEAGPYRRQLIVQLFTGNPS